MPDEEQIAAAIKLFESVVNGRTSTIEQPMLDLADESNDSGVFVAALAPMSHTDLHRTHDGPLAATGDRSNADTESDSIQNDSMANLNEEESQLLGLQFHQY